MAKKYTQFTPGTVGQDMIFLVADPITGVLRKVTVDQIVTDLVYRNLSAQGTNVNTTSLLTYGTNIFTTVTTANLATKLPSPTIGKSLGIVNKGLVGISVYPSNVGGLINGVVDTPVYIPPDGIQYTFHCIDNPLPGAWTITLPATMQMEIGEMSVAHTNGVANSGGGVGTYISSSFGAGLDGSQNLLLTPVSTYWKTLNPGSPIPHFATKLKVYTNILASDLVTTVQLWREQAYKTAANAVTSGQREVLLFTSAGAAPDTGFGTVEVVNPGPVYSGNVGDFNTMYGFNAGWYNAFPAQLSTGIAAGQFSSFYTSFGISIPADAISKTYKFKFFLEGY